MPFHNVRHKQKGTERTEHRMHDFWIFAFSLNFFCIHITYEERGVFFGSLKKKNLVEIYGKSQARHIVNKFR